MVFTMKEIKEPVLCISQDALKEQRIPNTGMGILPFDWTKVDLGYVARGLQSVFSWCTFPISPRCGLPVPSSS